MSDVTINVYPGASSGPGPSAHPDHRPSRSLLDQVMNTPFTGDKDRHTLELTVRARSGDRMVMVSMVSRFDDDTVRLKGIIRSPSLSREFPLELTIEKTDLAGIRLAETGPTELALLDLGGQPTDYRFRSWSVTTAIDGRYVIHAGIARNRSGHEAEFVASIDPGPALPAAAVVTIVIVGVLGVICLMANIAEMVLDYVAINACVAAGGIPNITITGTPHCSFGPGWQVNISCSYTSVVTCTPRPIAAVPTPTGTTGPAGGGTGSGSGGGGSGTSGGGGGSGGGPSEIGAGTRPPRPGATDSTVGYRFDHLPPTVGGEHAAFRTEKDLWDFVRLHPPDPTMRYWKVEGKLVRDEGGPDGLIIRVKSYTEIFPP